jgi:hypothetical protein
VEPDEEDQPVLTAEDCAPGGFNRLAFAWNVVMFLGDLTRSVEGVFDRLLADIAEEHADELDRKAFTSSVGAGIESL